MTILKIDEWNCNDLGQDSTGKMLCIGSRVLFRGEEFTVESFGPLDSDGFQTIKFREEINHTNETPTECSVDRLT